MSYRRILLASDGSDHAMAAARQAAVVAKRFGAEIEVVSVGVIHPMYGGLHLAALGAEGLESGVEEAAQLALDDTVALLREEGLEPTTVLSMVMGNPATVIAREAEDYEADLIVIGSRGLGRAGTFFLGSTSVGVLHEATVPVLVVK